MLFRSEMTAGEQALKLQITGSYVNVDWLYFCEEENCADTIKTAIHAGVNNQNLELLSQVKVSEFNVFSITGKHLGRIHFDGSMLSNSISKNDAFAKEMKFAGYTNGVYIVRAVKGEKALKIVVKE